MKKLISVAAFLFVLHGWAGAQNSTATVAKTTKTEEKTKPGAKKATAKKDVATTDFVKINVSDLKVNEDSTSLPPAPKEKP
jgi:hypothetical protein